MAEYRVPEFTLEQRAEAAVQMLVPLPDREWGPVSERARLYGVSRTLLYEIRDRALEAVVEETKAIELFDNWCWLLGEARLSLEPITPTYHSVSVADTKATVTTALELLKELDHPAITTFAEDLQEKLPELLAPLEWLEQQLTPVLKNLDTEAQAVILWAWQHRQELNLNIDTDIPQKPRSVVRTAWDILGLFHRSSSLAESLHSWLRPYLQVHPGELTHLSMFVSPSVDFERVNVRFVLPDGIELVDGKLDWTGALLASDSLERQIAVLASRPGEYIITGFRRVHFDLVG